MQLAKIPHTHQTTPRATSAAGADQHGTHRGRNRYHPSAHTTKDECAFWGFLLLLRCYTYSKETL